MLGVRIPPGLPDVLKRKKMFGKIIKSLKEVRAELTKVTWPTRQELIGSTIVTIVVTLLVSVFIGIVDRILTLAMKSIFG